MTVAESSGSSLRCAPPPAYQCCRGHHRTTPAGANRGARVAPKSAQSAFLPAPRFRAQRRASKVAGDITSNRWTSVPPATPSSRSIARTTPGRSVWLRYIAGHWRKWQAIFTSFGTTQNLFFHFQPTSHLLLSPHGSQPPSRNLQPCGKRIEITITDDFRGRIGELCNYLPKYQNTVTSSPLFFGSLSKFDTVAKSFRHR